MKNRERFRIGMPRVLNMYTYAPFFNGYFAEPGRARRRTSSTPITPAASCTGKAPSAARSIPASPRKIGIAHVHNLIVTRSTRKKPLDIIFFPMMTSCTTPLVNCTGSNACPTVTATPETVKAAFTKENDVFAEKGIVTYLDPILNFARPQAVRAADVRGVASPSSGLSEEENERAIESASRRSTTTRRNIRRRAREVLDQLEREDRIGIVMLGRPYHHDPGLEPRDSGGVPEARLSRSFRRTRCRSTTTCWSGCSATKCAPASSASARHQRRLEEQSYSCSTNHKVWAAKFTARHPNLVALELSSFKCGHDAPIYAVIEGIIEQSGTPYFCFKDIDENKPTGSIKIRVETIGYFLSRYREEVIQASEKPGRISRHSSRLLKYNSATKQAKPKRQSYRPAWSK